MPDRHLPLHPDLDQLRRQARELLRHAHRGDPSAASDFATFHPGRIARAAARLADAQLVLARSYGASSWPRLVHACRLVHAIWRDDLDAVRALVSAHPALLHEPALVRPDSSWGPPMSFAANLGHDRLVRMLHELGATDLEKALDRAVLQGRTGTARMVHRWMGSPVPTPDLLGGPAYTLSVAGTALLLELGTPVRDAAGHPVAPVDVVLETDSRDPDAKHAILELYVAHGLALPDTPTMALHRGRIDLLEAHLRRDPDLLHRRFSHGEIYPPALGCHDDLLATHGTPLGGTTLLHMCVDYDELDIARWLIAHGADVNARAEVDADGFGGHTPLFNSVVAQPHYRMNQHGRDDEAAFARLLLAHGADPNVRVSLRKGLHPGYGGDGTRAVYRGVTAISWGERFPLKRLVSRTALALIAEHGGTA